MPTCKCFQLRMADQNSSLAFCIDFQWSIVYGSPPFAYGDDVGSCPGWRPISDDMKNEVLIPFCL